MQVGAAHARREHARTDATARPGIKSFKDFLGRCIKSDDVPDAEAAANRAMLKVYLETQCRNATKAGEEEDAEREASTFADFTAIWSYANQVCLLACLRARGRAN